MPPNGTCELCGAHEATCPYGPNGEEICFGCGEKNGAATMKQMAKQLFNLALTDEEAKYFDKVTRLEMRRRAFIARLTN